jgi:hypothetical protein
LPFNGSQGFYSPYAQRPGTLTTFGRWKKPLLTYFNIKLLTPALAGYKSRIPWPYLAGFITVNIHNLTTRI